MPRLVAFLRAINVGGHTVRMETLRRHFEALGLRGVETFIASGNIIFETTARDERALAQRIADRLHEELGYEVATFLRTGREVAAAAAHRPFPEARMRAAKAVSVGFLAEPLPAAAVKALQALETPDDALHVHGRELFWMARHGQGQSEMSLAVLERALNIRATFRGLKTVERLVAKYAFTTSAA